MHWLYVELKALVSKKGWLAMGDQKKNRPSGFTLVELLVVVVVITLMTSLLAGVSYRLVVGARESATATTVAKANGIIQDRVRGFHEFDFSDAAIRSSQLWSVTPALAEVLYRKLQFKRAFPQAFAELTPQQKTRFFGSAPLSSLDPKYESGVVLYAVLLKGDTFGAPTPGEDTFSGAEVKISSETAGLPCLVDGWGEPLRFYRWPTRLIRCGEQGYSDYNQNGSVDPPGWVEGPPTSLSPAIRPNTSFPAPTPASLLIANLPAFDGPYVRGPDNANGLLGGAAPLNTLGWPDTDDPEPLNTDPDDPTYKLSMWLFDPSLTPALQVTRRQSFVTGTSSANFVDAFHDFYTFHTPLIVSSGPDRRLGLYEPTDVPTTTNPNSINFGYLAAPEPAVDALDKLFDNITNLNQRAGGK